MWTCRSFAHSYTKHTQQLRVGSLYSLQSHIARHWHCFHDSMTLDLHTFVAHLFQDFILLILNHNSASIVCSLPLSNPVPALVAVGLLHLPLSGANSQPPLLNPRTQSRQLRPTKPFRPSHSSARPPGNSSESNCKSFLVLCSCCHSFAHTRSAHQVLGARHRPTKKQSGRRLDQLISFQPLWFV